VLGTKFLSKQLVCVRVSPSKRGESDPNPRLAESTATHKATGERFSVEARASKGRVFFLDSLALLNPTRSSVWGLAVE
jgi:hypothetical protein